MEHGRPSGSAGGGDGPPSIRDAPGSWLVANGLYVEAALVGLAVVLAVLSLLLLFVGALLSVPMGPPPESGAAASSETGPSPIVDLGELLFNGGILVAAGLGFLLVAHAVVELVVAVSSGRDLDLGEPTDLAYVGVRTLQTVGAVAFAGTVAVGFVLARLGVIPDDPSGALGLVVLGGGAVMIGSVVAHALGRVVRTVADGW
ncbi:hypothetical protein [Haloarchaeobius baliensis]|uniref:hypothetical protein n=1 Tax=Haloarchaeobius baliensis TaxID=1670458 RepID=UPI003F8855C6